MKEVKTYWKKILATLCAITLIVNGFWGMGSDVQVQAAERKAPWQEGYVRVTPNDFGYASGEYSTSQYKDGKTSIHKRYVDMMLKFPSNASNLSLGLASTTIENGIRIKVVGDVLQIYNAWKSDDVLALSKDDLGGISFDEYFNFQIGFELGEFYYQDNAAHCKTVKVSVWRDDVFKAEKVFENVRGAGHGMSIQTSDQVLGLLTPQTGVKPEDYGFERVTLADFGVGNGGQSQDSLGGAHHEFTSATVSSFNMKYIDLDVAFRSLDASANINLASVDGWAGIRIARVGNNLCVGDAWGLDKGYTIPLKAGKEENVYNIKLGIVLGTIDAANTCDTVTMYLWVNDAYEGKKTMTSVRDVGNHVGIGIEKASDRIFAYSPFSQYARITSSDLCFEEEMDFSKGASLPDKIWTQGTHKLTNEDHSYGVYYKANSDEVAMLDGKYMNLNIRYGKDNTAGDKLLYLADHHFAESVEIWTPSTEGNVQGDITPASLGYTRVLMSDYGYEDKVYGPDHDGGASHYRSRNNLDLNRKYIDTDVAFTSEDDKTSLRFASADGWNGIIVGVIKSELWGNNQKLCVFAAGGVDAGHFSGLQFTASELGLVSFKEKFNLKLGFEMGEFSGTTCSAVKVTVWVNNKYVGQKTYTQVPEVGQGAAICGNPAADHENGWGGIGISLVDGQLIFDSETDGSQVYKFDAATYGIVANRFFDLKIHTARAEKANGLADVVVRVKVNDQDLPLMKFENIDQYGESMGIYTSSEKGSISTQAKTQDNNPVTFALNEELSEVLEGGSVKVVLNPSKVIVGQQEKAYYNGLTAKIEATQNTIAPWMKMTNRGEFEFIIPASAIPTGGSQVTLWAGELKNMEHTVTMNHESSFKFYVNKNGVSASGFIANVANHTVRFQNSSATSAPVLITDTTAIEGIFSAVDKPNEGIFINGVKDQDAQLVWDSAQRYHIAFSKEVKQGDIVIVYGDFRADNSVITLSTAIAIWTASDTWYNNPAGDLTTMVTVKHETNAIVYDITDQTHIVKTENTTYKKLVDDGKNLDDVPENYAAISLNGAVYEEGLYGFICPIGVTSVRYYVRLTASTRKDTTPVPEGPTGSGRQITSVTTSEHGTTVIGVSDYKNGYQPDTEALDDYGYDYVLDFDSDREFKILQITDTQIIDSSQRRYEKRLSQGEITKYAPENIEDLAFSYIRELVKKTNPDLIIMTGDNVYGEFDDSGAVTEAFVAFMETLKIPWAPVYGNHDNESIQGVEWQNAQYENAVYCLFKARHNLGGNGNYSIGLSRHGEIERAVYMMDSNGCGDAYRYMNWSTMQWVELTNTKNKEAEGDVKTSQGFTPEQTEWYYDMALRTNSIAGKTIPHILGFHIQTTAIVEGSTSFGYWYDETFDNKIRHEIGRFEETQEGDMGSENKNGADNIYTGGWGEQNDEQKVVSKRLIQYMNATGGDGAFFGHEHVCNASIDYAGIRWTFGLKTGTYDEDPKEDMGEAVGGTVIQLKNNSKDFTVTHVPVEPTSAKAEKTVTQEDVHYDLSNGAYILQGENLTVDGVRQYTGWELNQPGVYEVSAVEDGVEYKKTIHLFLTGDVDLDGVAGTAKDWATLKEMVYDVTKTDSTKATTAAQYAADLDNDGKVGFADVHLAQDIVDGKATLQEVKEQYDVPVQTYDHIGGEEVMPIIGTTADTYSMLKETGVNMVNAQGTTDIQDILGECDTDGIGVLVDGKELVATSSTYNDYFVNAETNLYSATEVAQIMSEYSSHPSYVGNYMTSGTLAKDTSYVLNSYTNTQGILRTDAEHADAFVQETNPTVLTAEGTTVAETYLTTLQAIRTAAAKNKLPFWANVKVEETDAKTYWNANVALALGAKGIEWGKVADNATTVKAMNEHIVAVDEVLLRAKSEKVINTKENNDATWGKLASYEATDATIGCFNYRDTEAYYVVNNDISDEQTVTLELLEECDYRIIAEAKETYGTSQTITMTIPAGQGVLLVLEDRTVIYDEVQEYRGTVSYENANGQTVSCERSADKENEVYTYAAPDAEPGYIFAGWYVEGTKTDEMDRNTRLANQVKSGVAIAKFVPDETLTVKAQARVNATNANKRDLRFVTTVDNLEYDQMGYEVIIGERAPITNKSRYVYSELMAEGSACSPREWCQMSNWFKAVHITGFTESMFDTPVTARPFWITWDGTKVYADPITRTVGEGF